MGKLKRSGENSKAVDARNRKKDAKAQANAKAAKDKEDAYWYVFTSFQSFISIAHTL